MSQARTRRVEKDLDVLMESLRKFGLLEPVTLYKNKDGSVHGKLPDWVNPISRKSGNLTQTCIFGRYGRKYVGKNPTSGQGETHDSRGMKWDW